MDAPVLGIDHVVIAVSDIDATEQAYARLGFTPSPRGVHSAEMGTVNHTMMLERDYFETLAVTTPTERNLRWRKMLERGDGVAGLALATPDAGAVRDAWASAGLAASDVIDFQRPVVRENGTVAARFQTVSLVPPAEIGLEIFACAQLTREAVWLPELLYHRNTARAIGKVTIPVAAPARAAEICRPIFAACAISAIDGGMRVTTGRHWIDLIRPEASGRGIDATRSSRRGTAIGIDLIVKDIDACRNILSGNGVATRDDGQRIEVSPDDAAGVALAFTTAEAQA